MKPGLSFFIVLMFLVAAQADSLWLSPKNDPDVLEHSAKGYFELPVDSLNVSGMTQERVQQMAGRFLEFYAEKVHASGRELEVRVLWENPYFTAHASHEPNRAVVVLWGGFLRAPGMSDEVVVTALCHELGHLIGGEPFQTIDKLDNFSTEGQSDFYAASSCIADFTKAYPEYSQSVSAEVFEYCDGNLNCSRALEGGLQTIRFMEKWGWVDYIPAQLSTPEKPAEIFVPNRYPSLQCRLDTFAAGARCLVADSKCARPACWWP